MTHDSPLPSIAEIAQRAGVAKSTVSMALRGHTRISARQRERIGKIATQMGYQTNALLARLMNELRSSRKQRHVATLAFVNASLKDPRLVTPSSIVEGWDAGAEARAGKLGYTLDRFWLHEEGMSPGRLASIFRTRNVQGVVYHSLDDAGKSRLHESEPIWSQFPLVTIGSRPSAPPLHFVSNDQYSTAMQACGELLALGHKRIGLYMARSVDDTVEHRFVMGYRARLEQEKIKSPPVLYIGHPGSDPLPFLREDSEAFAAWLGRHRLDACLAVNGHIFDWARHLGLRLPDDLGVALLYLPKALRGKVAGMEQRLEWTGMAAIDVVIGQILRHETGVPPFQQGTLIESSWVPGPTVRTTR